MKRTLLTFLITIFIFVAVISKNKGANAEYDVATLGKSAGDVHYLNWADHDEVSSGQISIVTGTSQVLRFQRVVSRVAISDESICDVKPLGKHEVLLYAKEAGNMNLIVWDDQFNVASYEVESVLDTETLRRVLAQIDPEADLNILPFRKTIAVSGTVTTLGKIQQVKEAIKTFDEKAISNIKIAEPKQILLEVRFAEVNRKSNRNYGLDLEALAKDFYIRSLSGQTGASPPTGGAGAPVLGGSDKVGSFVADRGEFAFLNAPTSVEGANFTGAFIGRNVAVQPFLKWLVQKNVLKIIHRPNLVTVDGEEASFLAGGEFPVPITTEDAINIVWKVFGTTLIFRPEIQANGVIRLEVRTEVSELDFSNTVSVSGTTVPTVLTRRHQTVAELKDNESLVIGGLLTQRVNRVKKFAPWLGKIPIIGAAFRKEDFSRTDVELLIVITPHIVHPIPIGEQKAFYDPERVLKSVQAFHPPYPDEQGDAINELMVQEEGHQYFDEETKKKSRETAEEIVEETEGEGVELNPADLDIEPIESTESEIEDLPGIDPKELMAIEAQVKAELKESLDLAITMEESPQQVVGVMRRA